MAVGSREGLAKAISNIERFYPVVGVLERFSDTLQMLEYELPTFFKGAFSLYFDQMNG